MGQMGTNIKRAFGRVRDIFEAYGDESTRDTFEGELNYDAGKIYYMMVVALFGWLHYIPTDLSLHKYPIMAVCLRFGLSALGMILIALKFTRRFRNSPGVLLAVLVFYLNFVAAFIAATAGENSSTYIGGLGLVFMITTFATLSVMSKAIFCCASTVLLIVLGLWDGIDFQDNSVRYAINDLFIALLLSTMLSYILNGVKRLSWERQQQLKLASKVKSDFLAKMSHEIRTPMNAITGMSELALRKDMPPAVQEHVLTIKHASASLISIINDILDLSKIESGKLSIVPREYHFGTLVNDVVSIIRMRLMDSPVRFVVNVDSNIPAILIGDEVRVRQILINILSNAVKYTSQGHISLVIKGIPAKGGDTVNLYIDISDTGKGIRQEDIKKLFGNFVRVDMETNHFIEGAGLGLVITKNLTTAMGGDIAVQSAYGKGSTFKIALPQGVASAEPLASVDSPEAKSVIVYDRREIYADSIARAVKNLNVPCKRVRSADELCDRLKTKDYAFAFVEAAHYEDIKDSIAATGSDAKIVLLTCFGHVVADKNLSVIAMPAHTMAVANILNGVSDGFSYHKKESTVARFTAPEARVLVVDDIRTNLEVTRGLLSPYKMQVDVCLSGEESITLSGEFDYDLIFMDHMMPGMNGITAARRIRAQEEGTGHRTPIVALTANAIAGAKEMFLENDFDGFLSKPVDIPAMNAILEKWIPGDKQVRDERKTEIMEAIPMIIIPGVDTRTGINRVGGDIDTYMRTLAVFRDDAGEKALELRAHHLSGNLQMFAIAAHALKGAASNIGAAAFSESAKAMETAGKQGDIARINKNIETFLKELSTLSRNIADALLTEKQRHSTPLETAGAADIAGTLKTLADAIETLDPDAINAASAALRKPADTSEYGAALNEILKNVLIGEYDAALEQIETLLKDLAR